MVFTDWDLGTGVDEEKATKEGCRGPKTPVKKGALFTAACAYILLYKEALGKK